MTELNAVAMANDAVLYIDDAHGTGVLGEQGRGTVLETLGSYENTFVVGSLSKAFSSPGASSAAQSRSIGCSRSDVPLTSSAGRWSHRSSRQSGR